MYKRQQLLSVILPLLLLRLVASAAETPALQAAIQRNELQRVNVIRGTDEIRVEITARGTVTPKVSKANTPSRVIVDLPGTVMLTGKRQISVGTAGVQDVRIAMDAQRPPTTRIVVDLDHSCRYELNPTADGNLVLTLHTQATTEAGAKAPKAAAKNSTSAANAVTPRVPEVKAQTNQDVTACLLYTSRCV